MDLKVCVCVCVLEGDARVKIPPNLSFFIFSFSLSLFSNMCTKKTDIILFDGNVYLRGLSAPGPAESTTQEQTEEEEE